jgi:hypothetical protein
MVKTPQSLSVERIPNRYLLYLLRIEDVDQSTSEAQPFYDRF